MEKAAKILGTMAIREVLKMGDPRLLAVAEPVREFGTPDARKSACRYAGHDARSQWGGARCTANRRGLARRDFRLRGTIQRYPEADPVPFTVLINPILTPLSDERRRAGKAACRSPACAGWCRGTASCAIPAVDAAGVAHRSHGQGLSCPGRAARSGSPRRHPVSAAHSRPDPVRLQRRAVPR